MKSDRGLAQAYMENRPAAAARVLESLPPAECASVLRDLPARVSAGVLSEMLPTHAGRCAEAMPAERTAGILEKLSPGHAAVILRGVEEQRRDDILDNLPAVRKQVIELLLSYPPSMVGAWIEPAVFALREETTLAEARKQLRASEESVCRRIFVLDDRRRPVGEMDLAELMRSRRRCRVGEAADGAPRTLRARSSLALARDHRDWRNHMELPVVNRRGEFVGCLQRDSLERGLAREMAVGDGQPAEAETLGTLLWLGVRGVWTVCSDLAPGRRK